MRNNSYFLVIGIILFTIFSQNVSAPSGGTTDIDYSNPSSWSDSDYQNADYSQVTDWSKIDQSRVPPGNINQIPADKVDVLKVQDQSGLTQAQLNYGGNYNKVNHKSDLSKQARDDYLTDLTGQNVQTDLPPETQGTAQEDGSFTFTAVNSMQVDATVISGATNVIYSNGIIKADHADSFTTLNSISTDIDNLEVKPTVFSVGSADLVISGCVNVGNAKNSTFQIYNNAVVVQSSGSSFNITDCDRNEVEFSAVGSNSNITITKSVPPKYKIYNGILSDMNGNAKESIATNSTAVIKMGNNGIGCMELNSVATYRYSENTIKDFAINIPPPQSGQL